MSAVIVLASIGLPAIPASAAATATVIAGTPGDGPLVNDIPATSAQFWNPADVKTTSDGTIYIADKNHNQIRSIGTDGIIHGAFGDGVAGCAVNSSTQTRLYNPTSLTVDEHDNIYTATGCGQIIQFTPGNPVGTVVAGKFDGTGNPNPVTADGTNALNATMQPSALSYDRVSGALYFYDSATGRVLQLASGLINIVAGTGVSGFSGDNGPATAAQLSYASNTFFANGNLYISDGGNCRVRMVATDGTISTIAGNGICSDQNDNGPATAASIEYPGPMAMDANEMLYIGGSLSGSVFAYDTQTKNISPVIQIASNTTGLAIEPSGNLLALHSGVNQQLYRITGLPSPTPPPDGKQHGKVTSVSWGISPTSALWTMDVTVKTSGVSCPGVAVVTVGTWRKRAPICSAGQTVPNNKTITFSWKVFNDRRDFQPGSTQAVTAFIAKSDAPHYGDATTTLSVTGAPTLVGVGDSFLSGHNQLVDTPLCERPEGTPPDSTLCGLNSNDYNFSWVTRMAIKLGNRVPVEWLYDYDSTHLLARSGATTAQMLEQGQVASMVSFLQQHPNTWNIVAFDGGANDIHFGDALADFYHKNPTGPIKPWSSSLSRSQCPDSESLYQSLFGPEPGSGAAGPEAKAPSIGVNLSTIVDAARSASSTVRMLDMYYPYSLSDSSACTGDVPDPGNPSLTQHGADSVVNGLNSLHGGLTGSDILKLDLRTSFGTNPQPKLQLTRYYGFPHPNDAGQNKIAQQALKLLK